MRHDTCSQDTYHSCLDRQTQNFGSDYSYHTKCRNEQVSCRIVIEKGEEVNGTRKFSRTGTYVMRVPRNRVPNDTGRTHTKQVRSQGRQQLAVQRASNRRTFAIARYAKENAPKWGRILANIAQVALVSIALYAFCTLVAAIELGWII